MNKISLAEYLTLRGVNLHGTYLHVIREPNASRDWHWASEKDKPLADALLDAVRLDTCHNKAGIWKHAKSVAVLLDPRVKSSPLNHIANSYLFMGVLGEIRRRSGVRDEDRGDLWTKPAWEMKWSWTDGEYLFLHPGLTRGFKFRATGDRLTAANHFSLLGSTKVPSVIVTPTRIRGFQLTFSELQERIDLQNWREFLDAPGVYLIQVFDFKHRDFYRYVGMARSSLRDRWEIYAQTGGTAGSQDGDGNMYLARLCAQMGNKAFAKNWRIQVIRLADTDEVRAVEKEVKQSLCTYHLDANTVPETFRSFFGLNGN